MRIAVAGKGGAGKTTISATLARLHARQGGQVVAIDGDSNPNLGAALGIDRDIAGSLPSLPASIVSRRLNGPGLRSPVEEVLATHAITGPDGVRLVLMGMPAHAEEGCMCSAHATVSALLCDLGSGQDALTIVDMEASPEHLSRGTTRNADALVLVTEPYWRSLETVRRLAALASELPIPRVGVVLNKVRDEQDLAIGLEFCEQLGLERLGEVPRSDQVVDADRDRIPLIDAAPDGAAVGAISHVLERLQQTVQSGVASGGA